MGRNNSGGGVGEVWGKLKESREGGGNEESILTPSTDLSSTRESPALFFLLQHDALTRRDTTTSLCLYFISALVLSIRLRTLT